MLAEYGAFEILGYQTFTTEIFTEFQRRLQRTRRPARSRSCSSLLSLIVLSARTCGSRSRPGHRSGPLSAGLGAPGTSLGRAHACRCCSAFGAARRRWRSVCRSATIVYWIVRAGAPDAHRRPRWSTPPGTPRSTARCGRRARDACWRCRWRCSRSATAAAPTHAARAQHLPRARRCPGLVIALALVYFAERYADGFLYQSAPLLDPRLRDPVLPARARRRAGLGRAGTARAWKRSARSLGQRPLAVLCARHAAADRAQASPPAFCLVFLSAVTELTATLILIPTGVQTLATQFWAYEQNLSYGAGRALRAGDHRSSPRCPSYVLGRLVRSASPSTRRVTA